MVLIRRLSFEQRSILDAIYYSDDYYAEKHTWLKKGIFCRALVEGTRVKTLIGEMVASIFPSNVETAFNTI